MASDAAQLKSSVNGTYVTNDAEISAWRDVVVTDSDIESYTRVILMSLPIFLDKESWVIDIDLDGYVDQTGRSRNLAEEHLPKAVASQYVERDGEPNAEEDGEGSYVIRLRFPD